MASVLLAHASPVMRVGLCSVLVQTQGIVVVADTSEGGEALQLALEVRPDVALLAQPLSDGFDGVTVAERIKAAHLRMHVLGLGAPDDDELLYRMLRAGAMGCISERAPLKAIIRAVEGAARGHRLWTPEQLVRVQCWWDEVGSRVGMLTEREQEVLVLLTDGLSNREIAQRLGIGARTIQTHVSNVLGKLQVKRRQEAIAYVMKVVGRTRLWHTHSKVEPSV